MPLIDVVQALEYRIAASPWPGFDPEGVPASVYDGDATFLVRHPAPPAEFQPVDGHPGAYRCPGRHSAVVASTVALIGETPTATVMARPGDTPVSVAATVVHEAFHVWQRQYHPTWWGCDEGQALTYPVTSAPLHQFLLLELEALEQALAAPYEKQAPWVRLALQLRAQRYALLSPGAADYERCTERLEGLAFYVEMQVAAADSPDVPRRPLRFGPDEVRRRSYAIGFALATLLDRFAPTWKASLNEHDDRFLDQLLAAALPAGVAPALLPDDATSAALAQAERDVAEVSARRRALRDSVAAREGWRLEVVAAPNAPLRPRGFDPMNVQPLTSRETLHTRFLRLGCESGTVERFGEALTEAAGAHPLFEGIARLVIPGLAESPVVTELDGSVTVAGPGLEASFQGAGVTQSGQVITVLLR